MGESHDDRWPYLPSASQVSAEIASVLLAFVVKWHVCEEKAVITHQPGSSSAI